MRNIEPPRKRIVWTDLQWALFLNEGHPWSTNSTLKCSPNACVRILATICGKLNCFSEYSLQYLIHWLHAKRDGDLGKTGSRALEFKPWLLHLQENYSPSFSLHFFLCKAAMIIILISGSHIEIAVNTKRNCFYRGEANFSFSKSNLLESIGEGNDNFTSSGLFGQSVDCSLSMRNSCSFLMDSSFPQVPQGLPWVWIVLGGKRDQQLLAGKDVLSPLWVFQGYCT